MRNKIRFLWNATRGHRFTPWRSPYLLWRIETYTGVKMKQIGFLEFWEFMWRERGELWRFLKWGGGVGSWAPARRRDGFLCGKNRVLPPRGRATRSDNFTHFEYLL